jgi:hypothetical protein
MSELNLRPPEEDPKGRPVRARGKQDAGATKVGGRMSARRHLLNG